MGAEVSVPPAWAEEEEGAAGEEEVGVLGLPASGEAAAAVEMALPHLLHPWTKNRPTGSLHPDFLYRAP